ncbi:MAG: hypothetical protein EXS40_06725, partial [Opitutaceae bacterium]|nr:hypothetical protein [Opitutaceae bacterium]
MKSNYFAFVRPRYRSSVLLFAAIASPIISQTAPKPSGTATNTSSASSPTPVQVMEAFTVTGSNIKRIDQETTLPVTVMNSDDLDLRGVSTAAELFDTLSIGGPITLDEGNTLGADARGDNNSINLRGIGSGNTLV